MFYIDVCVEYMDRVHFKKNPQCYQTNPKLEPSRTSKEGKAKKKPTWRRGLETKLKKIGKTYRETKQKDVIL